MARACTRAGEVASALAAAEARRVRKFRDAADEAQDRADRGLPAVPLLHVTRASGGSAEWRATMSCAEGHPNEGRAPLVCEWVAKSVLGGGTAALDGDPSGTYRLELHDSHAYLPRGGEYRDALSFGRDDARHPGARVARFPDPYLMSDFGGKCAALGPADDVPWHAKRSSVMFAGSTTGDTDPRRNARVQACLWALDHPSPETDFRITAIVQMNPFGALQREPRLAEVLMPPVPPAAHHRHRFLANIAGNTASWSRVPMVLRSRSVLFHLEHGDVAWYYPLLRPGEHYVACATPDDFLTRRLELMDDPTTCRRISEAANAFFAQHLTSCAAAAYARALLCGVEGA